MKTFKLTISGLLFFVLVFSCKNTAKESTDTAPPPPQKTEKIELFNGKDLTGLTVYIEDETYNKDSVFFVKDGLLCTTGFPNGYIKTDGVYENYKLNVEWRWVNEPVNSGVFLHKTEEDGIWPVCIEAQLWNQNAGDLVAMPGTKFKERVDTTSIIVKKYEESSEKPTGEWNQYEIICDGDNITVYVNGVLQNKATEVSVSKGHICLQSEGGPLEFRNFYLTPIDNKE